MKELLHELRIDLRELRRRNLRLVGSRWRWRLGRAVCRSLNGHAQLSLNHVLDDYECLRCGTIWLDSGRARPPPQRPY